MTEEKKRVARDTIDIIQEWKFVWMNQTQNSEADHQNYFRRAFGVDANMMHSLAEMIDSERSSALEQIEKLEYSLKIVSELSTLTLAELKKWRGENEQT